MNVSTKIDYRLQKQSKKKIDNIQLHLPASYEIFSQQVQADLFEKEQPASLACHLK